MKATIKEVAEQLAKKAEAIQESGRGYQAIVQEVMMIGGKAMISKQFTLAQAEYVASAMIAAITIARGAAQHKPPLPSYPPRD